MSRRAHPYFGHLNRLEQAATPGGSHPRGVPRMAPCEQEGVLWQAFRDGTAFD